jgi:glycosyltransferase involved in cell wall biosynthesis
VDISGFQGDFPVPKEDTIIYSGALSYNANFDAVEYFLKEIFPTIIKQRPNIKLYITGSTTGISLEKLPISQHVVFTGYLDDVRPAIAQSWANIVPLRRGGGTRLKILESLALGTPVVATPKGAEGLSLTPGHDFLLANNPKEFADAVINLLSNSNLRQQLSDNGKKAIKPYDWPIIGEKLLSAIESIASQSYS